ncbi:hypothetical protein TrVE_jg3615 [Triparma verrucosa]|uniref:Uncharacterized protein n=1 Tax=Triparma verrucosa TaxID=1606542 RepID=A0A9W7F5S1_9STRA|nr:hypothetical protein TrVE_jg3615 [Triparma verrucosa]
MMSHPPSRAHTHTVTVQARRVLDERSARKRAETDAQQLANRIQHLKDEVARSARRTEEASKRQREIKKQKMESEARKEHAHDGREAAMVSKKEIEEIGYYGTWVPGGGQIAPDKAKGMMKSEVMKLKAEREAKLLKANKKRIEEIKKKRLEMAAAKKKAEEIRIAKLKEQYKKKMEAEALKRTQAEKVVSKLEEEEARLIELLKEQQVQQQAAYTKLQETIVDGEGEGPSTD